MLALVPSALATPTGDFAPFADCPLGAAHLTVCVVSEINGGQLTIGDVTVPLKSITLQGGLTQEPESEVVNFADAADGKTLVSEPLEVPIGLFGDHDHGDGSHGQRFNMLTITPELAGPVQFNFANLLGLNGTGLTLPLKFKLGNPLLGRHCYIGSEEAPVTLNLTDGTTSPPPPNQPIAGKLGTIEGKEEFTLLKVQGTVLVDNAFAVARERGCGSFTWLVKHRFDLPSPGGENTAILELTQSVAVAEAVVAHG